MDQADQRLLRTTCPTTFPTSTWEPWKAIAPPTRSKGNRNAALRARRPGLPRGRSATAEDVLGANTDETQG